MHVQNITGLIDSPAQYFMESSWKGKTVLVLCALSFLSVIYYVAFRLMKTDTPPSQDSASLKGRAATKPTAPVEQDLSLIAYTESSIPGFPNEMMERVFQLLTAEQLVKIARVCKHWNAVVFNMSYAMPLPSWLKEITENTWKAKIDCKKYVLDFTGAPRINRRASTKDLWPLSERVEKKMGITIMVRPKNLTLKIVLQIAKDYSQFLFPLIGSVES